MPQCFIRLMPQLVPAEKGIIVEIIRAKQSATSLFGAHAKAGICPKIKKSVKCECNVQQCSIFSQYIDTHWHLLLEITQLENS